MKPGDHPERHINLSGLVGKQAISSLIQSSSLHYCFRSRVLVVCDICGGIIGLGFFFSLLHPNSIVKCKTILHCSKTRNKNCIRNKLALRILSVQRLSFNWRKKKKGGGEYVGFFSRIFQRLDNKVWNVRNACLKFASTA